MVNISDFEKKFRKRKRAILKIVSLRIDWDVAKYQKLDLEDFQTKFEAEWDKEEKIWTCYDYKAEESYNATTLVKVKQNMAKFIRNDPAIKGYKKITITT